MTDASVGGLVTRWRATRDEIWNYARSPQTEAERIAFNRAKELNRCADELSAALTAGGWQSIETAPKDGTPVLVWRPVWVHPILCCWLDGRGVGKPAWRSYTSSRIDYYEPTHWMMLPSAPRAQGEPT